MRRFIGAWLRGPRHVLPREIARRIGLFRKPEDALAEDVAHDVGSATFDGVRLGPQEAPRDRALVVGIGTDPSELGRAPQPFALPGHSAWTLEVDRELLQTLVELCLHELGDRPFGPRFGAAPPLV